MSREIKFRGWHTKMKKMFSAEEMAVDQMTLLPTGNFINCHSNVKLSTHYPADKFIPLQYIGLKDKKGIEIYEGDILELDDEFNKTKHEVAWGGKDYPAWTLNPGLDCETNDFSEIICGSSYTMEIIGNVYENFQLLEPPLGNNASTIRNISEDDWRKDDR